MTSDIEGMTKAAPLSRREFMTAAAATAAGYTLAAGPVRADVIKTDAVGLTVGDAKIAVSGGEMPVYFAKPDGVSNPPVILVAMEVFGLHEYIKDVVRRLAKLGAFAIAPDYYFRKGVDLTKITDFNELMPIVNAKPDAELVADLDATVAWAKSQGGDTSRLGIIGFCRGGRSVWIYAAHSDRPESGRCFLRLPRRSAKPGLAQKPDSTRARHESARARTLRRSGSGHPGLAGREDERRSESGGQDSGNQNLSRRAAWFSCGLPAKLPEGSGGRCLAEDGSLVQETYNVLS